jgi:hypothetical protein
MKRLFAASGLVLVAMSGVGYADSPGGWSQFNDLTAKAQGRNNLAPAQQVHPTPVYEFTAGEKRGTRLFPPNTDEGANN